MVGFVDEVVMDEWWGSGGDGVGIDRSRVISDPGFPCVAGEVERKQ